jgi:hypothetical protein
MAYSILFLRNAELVGGAPGAKTLAETQDLAIQHFTAHQQVRGVTQVQVRNDKNVPVFHFPAPAGHA